MSEEINIKFYDPEVEELRKENQQLKEKLDKATRVALSEQRWASKCEDRCINYQSVLDEIREYIENHIIATETEECILQILDKVKENERGTTKAS